MDEDIEKLERDSYDWVDNQLPDGFLRDVWEKTNSIRWILNAIFVGIPFVIFMFFAIGWNLWCNIGFNNWWA